MRLHFFIAVPFALAASFVQAQTLSEAMQKAVDVHPEIQAGVNARIAADYQVRAAQGGYLPKVDLLGGYGRESSDNTTTRAASNSHDWKTLNRGESSIRLQQNLFQGFGTQNEVSRQQATANSRGYALLNTTERTALTVAQVYLDVLTRREMVQLAEDNLKSHERIFDQIKLRTSRGVGRMADMDQAEARLAQARNNLLTEQTNLEDAKANYISAVGEEPDQLERPQGFVALMPANLEEARRQMVESSPVLRSAESDIAAAEKQYEAAKSTFYPRFDAELQRSANNNVGGEEGHDNGYSAMLRMQFNLYSGGSNKADLQSKASQASQALDIRNNALRELNQELSLAWNAYNNAAAQVPIAQEYVDRSTRVRTSYQQQFSLGERTLLDLLDSENELFTASQRLAQIKNLQLYTQYRIKADMGQLLRSQGIVAPLASVVQNEVKTKVNLPGMN
ncbi:MULTISPECIES: TolC family outer membrane protein [Pseudomonas]|uniref:Outer membrane protein, adhesin transport system n=1 Tax=Pseudomonas poae TaxID=200451 RepID=A0AAP2S2F8_9PSED|nr:MULTISPECIES: TolC family outer membrane protein [Pseudomonas]ELQ14946.1 TolC family type I secretion outer membrane protein [Pseudomonas fluorescens BRIP34879]KTC34258.1 channel protein TolC [Pseudomonas sp. ABAC21]AGE28541.1 TolC family type I secretion outer membrane protein [Pseudomonas poae RE*1-1-14]KRP46545.1 channel protein TolC [Pseudomonas poae]MBC3198918.1 TolC family outer membrane protein [Pseudomonas poae]